MLPYSSSSEEKDSWKGEEKGGYYASPVIGNGEETTEEETQHFGPAPEGRLLRRHKTKSKRRVKLMNGNLVVEAPVPTRLAALLPSRGERERMSTT